MNSFNVFLVTTYNIQYLMFSLSSIKRYVRQSNATNIIVVINNDSPKYKVTEEYCRDISGIEVPIFIRNTDVNKAHLGARLDALDFLNNISQQYPVGYFMFVDDDDVVLSPSFESIADIIQHRAVVVHRLLEVLQLINNPVIDLTDSFLEYEEWKAGCVGNPMKFTTFYDFIKVFKGFLPDLYKFYGSTRVMEPDDMFLMICFHIFLEFHVKDWNKNCVEYKDTYSYALTLIEDRRFRYEVDPNAVDLRYGTWDGKTSYQGMYNELGKLFSNYLKQNNEKFI